MTCTFPDCDRPQRTRGLCAPHYTQWRRHGECKPLSTPGGQRKNRKCDAPDCNLPHYGHGYCERHYTANRRGQTIAPLKGRKSPEDRGCDVADCDRPHKAGGLCRLHWERLQRGVPLDGPVRRRRRCEFPGCERQHNARGLCKAHGRQHNARGLCKAHGRQRDAGQELHPIGERKPKEAKPRKRAHKPRAPKSSSNLPDGWFRKEAKVVPLKSRGDFSADALVVTPNTEEELELALAYLTRTGNLDLADMLGLVAA